jgi:hypothetical protein
MGKRVRRNLRFLGFSLIICLMGVLLVLMISQFFSAFYTDISIGYEPKDLPREELLERKGERPHRNLTR